MKISLRQLGSSSKAWLNRQKNDVLVRQAKEMDLRARSSFKLQEINAKHKIISSSSLVLDLGAAPGGWSVIVSQILKPESGGAIVAVDLLPIKPVPNTVVIEGDFTTSAIQKKILQAIETRSTQPVFDVILSDMLHNTTGVKETDHIRSMNLVDSVIDFATTLQLTDDPTNEMPGLLHKRGSLLCKYLQGGEEKDLIDRLKLLFEKVEVIKPKSSRSESREVYLLARNRKNSKIKF
jgi:23S rRNA (uridine2552-2'-O)-methyltransferase